MVPHWKQRRTDASDFLFRSLSHQRQDIRLILAIQLLPHTLRSRRIPSDVGRTAPPEEASMETKVAREQTGWRWIVITLVLAAFLAATLIVSVAQITHPADQPIIHAKTEGVPVPNSIAPDADVGNFAFGYVEFDQNPKAPGGVPGFDSWPPGSPPPKR